MTINSRTKGCAGEREVRDLVIKAGFSARRGQQFSGSPDSPDVVHDLPLGIHIEVKRTERLNMYDAFEQAVRDAGAGAIPTVWHRRSRKPWLVMLPAGDFLELVKKAASVGVVPIEDFLS